MLARERVYADRVRSRPSYEGDLFHFERAGGRPRAKKYHESGTAATHAKNVARRRRLMQQPSIQTALFKFWRTAGLADHDLMELEMYISILQKIGRALGVTRRGDDPAVSRQLALEDWRRDMQACGLAESAAMPMSAFCSGLFELADVWTEGVDEIEYASFLGKLFRRITCIVGVQRVLQRSLAVALRDGPLRALDERSFQIGAALAAAPRAFLELEKVETDEELCSAGACSDGAKAERTRVTLGPVRAAAGARVRPTLETLQTDAGARVSALRGEEPAAVGGEADIDPAEAAAAEPSCAHAVPEVAPPQAAAETAAAHAESPSSPTKAPVEAPPTTSAHALPDWAPRWTSVRVDSDSELRDAEARARAHAGWARAALRDLERSIELTRRLLGRRERASADTGPPALSSGGPPPCAATPVSSSSLATALNAALEAGLGADPTLAAGVEVLMDAMGEQLVRDALAAAEHAHGGDACASAAPAGGVAAAGAQHEACAALSRALELGAALGVTPEHAVAARAARLRAHSSALAAAARRPRPRPASACTGPQAHPSALDAPLLSHAAAARLDWAEACGAYAVPAVASAHERSADASAATGGGATPCVLVSSVDGDAADAAELLGWASLAQRSPPRCLSPSASAASSTASSATASASCSDAEDAGSASDEHAVRRRRESIDRHLHRLHVARAGMVVHPPAAVHPPSRGSRPGSTRAASDAGGASAIAADLTDADEPGSDVEPRAEQDRPGPPATPRPSEGVTLLSLPRRASFPTERDRACHVAGNPAVHAAARPPALCAGRLPTADVDGVRAVGRQRMRRATVWRAVPRPGSRLDTAPGQRPRSSSHARSAAAVAAPLESPAFSALDAIPSRRQWGFSQAALAPITPALSHARADASRSPTLPSSAGVSSSSSTAVSFSGDGGRRPSSTSASSSGTHWSAALTGGHATPPGARAHCVPSSHSRAASVASACAEPAEGAPAAELLAPLVLKRGSDSTPAGLRSARSSVDDACAGASAHEHDAPSPGLATRDSTALSLSAVRVQPLPSTAPAATSCCSPTEQRLQLWLRDETLPPVIAHQPSPGTSPDGARPRRALSAAQRGTEQVRSPPHASARAAVHAAQYGIRRRRSTSPPSDGRRRATPTGTGTVPARDRTSSTKGRSVRMPHFGNHVRGGG